MFSWLRLRHVLLGLTAVFCVVGMVWAMSGEDRSTTSPDTAARTPTTTPTKAANPSDEELMDERVPLNTRVKAFTALYFSLSPAKSNTELRSEIQPYATPHFMESAKIGYGTSAADEAMLREKAELKAEALTGLDGHFDSPTRAFGVVQFRVTKFDQDGNIVWSHIRTQAMTWVKQGSTWLIDDLPIT